MQRMSVREYKQIQRKRQTKYNNRKTEVDGIVFDSALEARYYSELKLRAQTGDILFFRVQPRYLLQEGFEKEGIKHRKIEYVADFEVHHTDGSIEVIDTKGVLTDVFRIKEKMFHKKYPHKLTVLQYENSSGWIDRRLHTFNQTTNLKGGEICKKE